MNKIIITNDGSNSLFHPEANQHYHSIHGAVQESLHVFIKHGFQAINKNTVNILEVGFGTGLNCLLTLIESDNSNKLTNYTTLEPYPISQEIAAQLNFCETILKPDYQDQFLKLHEIYWNQQIKISDHFNLKKQKEKIQNIETVNEYDIVFFDAFDPIGQPEMWTEDVFEKIHKALAPEGILVTYCAGGIFKRTLKAGGFKVEALPGPPGKREMTRAVKK
jgi:tRNA U34 5-methylaminomethyl-2-thiouridine-forming methyltransferase MnmC